MKTPNELTPSILRAGVGRADITSDTPERPVRSRLYAKALVLDDGHLRIVLLTMDAVAIGGICDIPDDFLPALRRRIERRLNIPAHRVLVAATHTHPPGRILCRDEDLVARAFDAVRQAADSLCDVRIGAGIAQEASLLINRDLRLKDGNHWSIRMANPCPPDEDVVGVGPIDPTIGILRVDRTDGTPLAVVYNYGCHLLLGDPAQNITANFSGIASGLIEECLGHQCMAFFMQGASGDILDIQLKDLNRVRDVEPFGMKLGFQVLRALPGIQTHEGKLNMISEYIELPRRKDAQTRMEPLRREQEELLQSLRFTSLNLRTFLDMYHRYALNPDYPATYSYAYHQADRLGDTSLRDMDAYNRAELEKYVQNIRAMERLARIQDDLATYARHEAINQASGSDTILAEIQGIRIGDFVMVSAPIEILTEVGMNVKRASPHPHTYIAAFANGYMHYGPPASAYDKGGYEVIECFLAPEWQAIFEQKACDILRRV